MKPRGDILLLLADMKIKPLVIRVLVHTVPHPRLLEVYAIRQREIMPWLLVGIKM